ncbi:MAG: LLM class flavin-dependent oxidoreductase [Armatimonadota bacterium]|nr:LLM class flavin-dependent oxidoreductase [Armatimonadota bacterium]
MPIRLGVGVLQDLPPRELAEYARWCESLGYAHFWYANEKFYRDMYVGLTVAALSTSRILLGTFVADPYTCHPALTAVAIASVDEVSDGRAMLVLGAGGAAAAPLGFQRIRPAQAVGEAIQVIRQLLTGDRVTFEGQVITFRGGKLSFPARANLPIYVASRGDLVLSAAGELADGVMIATYATPEGIRHGLSRVRRGTIRAGRRLEDLALFARVDACISDDPREATEAVRPMVARLLGSSYPDRSFVRALGLDVPQPLEEILKQRNHALTSASAHLVPEELVRAYTWAGTAEQVAERVAAVADLGIQNITFLPHPPPGGNIRTTVRAFAEQVRPRVEALLKG